jgi:hypothetical protein
MPYGYRGGLWALLGPGVVLRRTDYDADAAAEMFRSTAPEYPGLAQFIEENVLTVPSDAEALAVSPVGRERSPTPRRPLIPLPPELIGRVELPWAPPSLDDLPIA